MRRIGRYALFDAVGHGGTATVHLGRLIGPAGFSKTVAIKRMHESVSRDSDVAAMFLDEARISARIRHPNVVAATDFLAIDEETFLVMEYVHGESLSVLNDALRSRGSRMPTDMAVHVLRDVLHGLHAAHETRDDHGRVLELVHRDVSPQNVQIGVDGTARVLDFGIAKALGRLQDTHTGQVKGKLSYMAPEQLLGQHLDRRVDVFAAGVVLWETVAGQRLFIGDNPGQVVQRVLTEEVPRLDTLVPGLSPYLSAAVARATSKDPAARFDSALDFARELERAAELVPNRAVGEWVRQCAGERLERRSKRLAEIESTPITQPGRAPAPGFARAPEGALRLDEELASMPAGPDDATRSEIHVRLAPNEANSPPRVKTSARVPAWRGRVLWAGAAAGVLVASAWLALDPEPTTTERRGTASASPVITPNAPELPPTTAPEPHVARASEGALRPTPDSTQPPGALEPERAVERSSKSTRQARARAARARERALASDKAGQAKPHETKPAVRRAEDLFSRN